MCYVKLQGAFCKVREVRIIYYLEKDPKKNSTKVIAISGVVLIFLVLLYVIISQVWGFSFFQKDDIKDFSVKGIQVSAEEGYLDWQGISDGGLSFAYIKATEGSSYVDDGYRLNWDRIKGTDIRRGASHYFSFDSPGATQAEHFLQVYQPENDDLPPVIMLELYDGKKRKST